MANLTVPKSHQVVVTGGPISLWLYQAKQLLPFRLSNVALVVACLRKTSWMKAEQRAHDAFAWGVFAVAEVDGAYLGVFIGNSGPYKTKA